MVGERTGSKTLKFYVPLAAYLVFLLFPFYWMANTVFKSDKELYNLDLNPFYIHSPTLDNVVHLFTETIFLKWMANTFFVAILATLISLAASLLAAYAIQRIRFKTSQPTGVAIFLGYLVPQTILFIPLAQIIFRFKLWDSLWDDSNVTAGAIGVYLTMDQMDARYLQISNDLSDVDDVPTARTNLGLGDVAVLDLITEAYQSLSDLTTWDVSNSRHG